MRILLSIGLAAVVSAGLVAPGVAPVADAVSTIQFGSCPADLAEPYPELTCATVQVPLDYYNPNPAGPKVNVLVSKRAATDTASRRGYLFLNPGGPGAGGAEMAGRMSKLGATGDTRLPPAVLNSYDLIGFDPRGVGHSDPVTCVDPSYWGSQPDPDNPANRDKIWQIWQTFAAGCDAHDRARLPFMGTRQVVQDMNHILLNLGQLKLNYFGQSYGTYIGQAFASRYPDRVGRMVLDSNMNTGPADLFYRAGLNQIPALQKRVGDWFAWIAKYDTVFHLGTTADQVRAKWLAVLADFRAAPHGPVGANELLSAVYGNAYSEGGWEGLAHALADWSLRGDDTALVEWASPVPSAEGEQAVAAFAAVTCLDSAWPKDRAVYERDAAELAKTSEFAWYNISNSLACANWSAGHQTVVPAPTKRIPRILLFNSRYDAATPYAGAQHMRDILPGSVLVTEEDSGKHGVVGNRPAERNEHAQRIFADFMVNGALPAGDISIPGHPLPVPSSATAASAKAQPVRAHLGPIPFVD